MVRDHLHQVLTNDERKKLATWILECADGYKPKHRTDVYVKMKEILRARHRQNKRRKYGTGSIPLSVTEVRSPNSNSWTPRNGRIGATIQCAHGGGPMASRLTMARLTTKRQRGRRR